MKMSLVAYGSSDEESDYDQEENEKEESNQSVQPQQTSSEDVNLKNSSVSENDDATLFSALPKPRKQFSFLEDSKLSKLLLNKNSLFGQKSEKESIKISVPSVSDFDEDNQPPTKKLKPSAKGVGLFSILPPPKNTAVKGSSTKLVPDSVKKVEVRKTVNKVNNVNRKNVNINSVSKKPDVEDDDDDGDDSTSLGNSFFGSSLSESNSSEAINAPSTNISQNDLSEVNQTESRINIQNLHDSNTVVSELQPQYNVAESSYDSSYYPSEETTSGESGEVSSAENGTLELDEKALQILCGNKQKRKQMSMNIIDLSGEEIMPDSKEWLLKQLSMEKKGRSHGHKKMGGPSTLQKRKHQITYLAYQAKEQELELQNQWVNNRMSKKQTQSKYGF